MTRASWGGDGELSNEENGAIVLFVEAPLVGQGLDVRQRLPKVGPVIGANVAGESLQVEWRDCRGGDIEWRCCRSVGPAVPTPTGRPCRFQLIRIIRFPPKKVRRDRRSERRPKEPFIGRTPSKAAAGSVAAGAGKVSTVGMQSTEVGGIGKRAHGRRGRRGHVRRRRPVGGRMVA